MVGLYKDPTGESIFSKSTLSGNYNSSLAANLTNMISKPGADDEQTATLKRRIEELEAKLEATEAKVSVNTVS